MYLSFYSTYIDTSDGRGCTSEGYFERVMINEFVDREGGVEIEGVHIVDLPVDRGIRWEPW